MLIKSDVWSIGIIAFKLITGDYPYNISQGAEKVVTDGIGQIQLQGFPPQCKV